MKSLENGIEVPQAFDDHVQRCFTPEILGIAAELHQEFESERQELLKTRRQRQRQYDNGKVPEFLDQNSLAVTSDWRVAKIPQDYLTRRVEITGPVNSAKMVINMLSRNAEGARADTAMLDFEDSLKPSWQNVLNGYVNVMEAVRGTLRFEQPGKKTYELKPDDMAGIMVRVRGLHLNESNFLVGGTPISGGMLDLIVCFVQNAKEQLQQKKTPKFYIPKCEHFLEARWWNKLFSALEKKMDFPNGTIRVTFLIETLTAAFQIEEILFEIREYATGLNVGRWDKIFSDIKILKNHGDRVMADRSEINMSKYWMDNYAKRLIKICHGRGAFAIGGMAPFTPGKDPELRKAQTNKVTTDKKNEFAIGHDGCWVSHPYFITYAMEAFPKTNQLERTLDDFNRTPDLIPQGEGPRTMAGLRTNIRVGIAYLQGWNDDIGCVSWDNLMEDLATLEISRTQVWQWIHHGITLEDGTKVDESLVKKLFDEELQRILGEVDSSLKDKFSQAKEDAAKLFLQKDLADFLCLKSDTHIAK